MYHAVGPGDNVCTTCAVRMCWTFFIYFLASITRLQTAASVTSATSLSQPCSSDAECRAADAGAVCHGGICTCAAFVPGGGGDPDSSGFLTPRPPPPRRLRRVSRSAEDWWFCTPGRVRLCPKGTFQVSLPAVPLTQIRSRRITEKHRFWHSLST